MTALASEPSTWAEEIKDGLQRAFDALPKDHRNIKKFRNHHMSGSNDVKTLTYLGEVRDNNGETHLLMSWCTDFMTERLMFPFCLSSILKHCTWTCFLDEQGNFCNLELTINDMEAVQRIQWL